MKKRSLIPFLLTAAFSIVVSAQDAVTVATVNASSTTVDVPVYIRDVAGTPLGMDASRIQSFSIKVTYAPASAVSSVVFGRSGVTQTLTPTSEFTPKTSNSVSLLDTFQLSTNPIPFTLNAAAPGNKVANLRFTLSDAAVPGTTITLTLDSALTQLTDEGGTASTKESAGNGRLALVNGAINVQQAPLTLAISPVARTIEVKGSATLTVTTSSAVPSATTVTLTSNSSAVTVPASVVIPQGSQQASFTATGVSEGSAVITARLPAGLGGASVTANIIVANGISCATPQSPQPSGPSAVRTGESYSITWPAVPNATDYTIEEATDASFSAAVSAVTTSTSAAYSHSAGTYFYRLRARNRSTGCDTASARSAVVTVVVTDAPIAAMRIVPVVGSTRGNAGSFFKTSVQLYNPTGSTLSGRIVFHPQGSSAGAGDASLAYAIAPGKTLAYDDLLPAMGIGSGIGSADLVADIIGEASSALPLATFRIYNDAGAAGTTGLVQEPMRAEDALRAGDTGALIAPVSVDKFRLNVGLRTLEQGAGVTITVRDADGATVATVNRTYEPVFFEQVGSAAFLDGYALRGGETISVTVTRGSAIVYGATTDNITNDPSQQFARKF